MLSRPCGTLRDGSVDQQDRLAVAGASATSRRTATTPGMTRAHRGKRGPGRARALKCSGWRGPGQYRRGRQSSRRAATWPPGPRRQYTAPAGCDLTLSAPKSASLLALVSGDERHVAAHDGAAQRTLVWVEKTAIETRMPDQKSGTMVHAGDQKMVAATFRHR